MSAGDKRVFGALEKETGLYLSWSMQRTPGFSEWCKESITSGLEVHEMSIAEMVEHLDDTREKWKRCKGWVA